MPNDEEKKMARRVYIQERKKLELRDKLEIRSAQRESATINAEKAR
jgi:hypothetical protein